MKLCNNWYKSMGTDLYSLFYVAGTFSYIIGDNPEFKSFYEFNDSKIINKFIFL